MTISKVTAGTFDVRAAVNGTPIPATLTFSPNWTILDIRFDDPNVMPGVDQAKLQASLQPIQKHMMPFSQFFGRWRVGEQRSTDLALPVSNGKEIAVKLISTFRCVTMVQDRSAAEFVSEGVTDFVMSGQRAHVSLNARSWTDLATGITLRASARRRADMQAPAGPVRMDFEQEDMLDLASSRL